MFWSKIYFFLIAAAAAVALTIALMLPAPARRQRLAEERQRVVTACDVVNILMQTNARSRIDLAGDFARSAIDVAAVLAPATLTSEITDEANQTARTVATQLIESTSGDKPEFVMLVDGQGRAVARVGMDEKHYGDMLAGYYLVDDALDGYLRDDLWLLDGKLYLVAASPVIGNRWAGAVVIGHLMDKDLVEKLVTQLGVHLTIYAGNQPVATSNAVPIHEEVLRAHAGASSGDGPVVEDCHVNEPFELTAGKQTYTALTARLPGEAGAQGAFFTVFLERPDALGLLGTLSAVVGDDLAFGNFPWILLGLGLIVSLALGIGLLIFEVDRPLRRLTNDAIRLAQGAADRLDEDSHRGHYGSVARSVNLRLEKIQREARESGGAGTSALPPVGPGGPISPAYKPPPPSEFKFTDSKPMAPAKRASSQGLPPLPGTATSPPLPGAPPLIAAVTSMRPRRLDSAITAIDDVLANASGAIESLPVDDSYRSVYEDFLSLKRKCGESTSNLTYEKFASKLRSSRESLMAKHDCEDVHFEVYIKDGKASLKAKPILTE